MIQANAVSGGDQLADSIISKSCVKVAVFESIAEAEQYFSLES